MEKEKKELKKGQEILKKSQETLSKTSRVVIESEHVRVDINLFNKKVTHKYNGSPTRDEMDSIVKDMCQATGENALDLMFKYKFI